MNDLDAVRYRAAGDGSATRRLQVHDLRVTLATDQGPVDVVSGVSFDIARGRTLALVGESGCGKTATGLAIMRLLPGRHSTATGRIAVDGIDVLSAEMGTVRALRGRDLAMIFQDPLSALHPHYPVRDQLAEAVQAHRDVSRSQARRDAVAMLDRVGIPNAERRAKEYPHQFSGGMRQRVMIAMALINGPGLLIADEPTTALDATARGQVIDLLREVQVRTGAAVLLITHDLGLVAQLADDVAVMYAGRLVEKGTAREVLSRPRMPYTWGLIGVARALAGVETARLHPIVGSPPTPGAQLAGCAFHPRCPHAGRVEGNRCATERPGLRPVSAGHLARCFLPVDLMQTLGPRDEASSGVEPRGAP